MCVFARGRVCVCVAAMLVGSCPTLWQMAGSRECSAREGGKCVYVCDVGGFRPLTSADAGLTRKRGKGVWRGLYTDSTSGNM